MATEFPRLMIAAIQGMSGKTTVTIGLLKALKDRGLRAQPYKKGPDYIDPSWATIASGVPCRNLDAIMMRDDQLIHSMCSQSDKADLAVVEGAMGIFDGFDIDGSNSSAELACLLDIPVILVVSGQRITRSVAALINGVVQFDQRIHIAGIILNRVARPRHLNIMTGSIEKYCNVPILGALPKGDDIKIPDRHLGLVPAGEETELLSRVDRLGELVEQYVDVDRILAIAKAAPPLADPLPTPPAVDLPVKPRIGVFRDRAFSFYYPENLEALVQQGADLVDVDAFADASVDELDGLYIGGGFPEVMAADLSANETLRRSVKRAADAGKPIYAECGGLMYLSRGIHTTEGFFPMCDVFPCEITMTKRPQGHGYAFQRITEANPFFAPGELIRGHEFHNSKVVWPPEIDPAEQAFGFQTERGKGLAVVNGITYDGLVYRNVLAGYHHYHAASDGRWAEEFVKMAFKQEHKC